MDQGAAAQTLWTVLVSRSSTVANSLGSQPPHHHDLTLQDPEFCAFCLLQVVILPQQLPASGELLRLLQGHDCMVESSNSMVLCGTKLTCARKCGILKSAVGVGAELDGGLGWHPHLADEATHTRTLDLLYDRTNMPVP